MDSREQGDCMDMLNNRECAKWHPGLREVCHKAQLIKIFLLFSLSGNTKDLVPWNNAVLDWAKWHASEQNDMLVSKMAH